MGVGFNLEVSLFNALSILFVSSYSLFLHIEVYV